MITEAIIIGLTSIFNFLISLFNLPSMPAVIVTSGAWLGTQVVFTVSFLRQVLSPELLTAIIAVFIAYYSFETLYHGIMWVIRKLPIGVK